MLQPLQLPRKAEKMNDKNFTRFSLAIGIGLLFWYFFGRGGSLTAPVLAQADNAAQDVLPQFSIPPDLAAFAANPSAFSPSTLDVNIGNQGYNYLTSKYIPLFGFVGMAQGAYFQ
jgi:hypothetical protein